MLKWIVLGVFVLGLACFALAVQVQNSGRSADERIAAAIPFTIGVVLIAGDVVFFIGYAAFRLFQ